MLTDKRISVVIPCYNEQENILPMYERLTATLQKVTDAYEIIYVNNGSFDDSDRVFRDLVKQDDHVVVLNFSRNFGSQGAYTGGLEHTKGDAVVCIDGDIQDPPELIEQMVQKWQEGFHIVYGVRFRRKGSLARRIGYKLFYRLFKQMAYIDIPLDAGDFALLDRRVVNAVNALPERNRFLRGLRAWVGFKHTGIEYVRDDRTAGTTSNSFLDNFRWAGMGIVSFSYKPLEYISIAAMVTMGLAFLGILVYMVLYFTPLPRPAGFASLIIAVLFLGGMQLMALSIIGQYIGKIFEEVKGRPTHIVSEVLTSRGSHESEHNS